MLRLRPIAQRDESRADRDPRHGTGTTYSVPGNHKPHSHSPCPHPHLARQVLLEDTFTNRSITEACTASGSRTRHAMPCTVPIAIQWETRIRDRERCGKFPLLFLTICHRLSNEASVNGPRTGRWSGTLELAEVLVCSCLRVIVGMNGMGVGR